MTNKDINQIYDSLSAPLGDIISSVARGVADAQQALDMRTIETFKEIYGSDDGLKEEMRRIGYQPTWYKIPEVSCEIVMSLSISENAQTNVNQIDGSGGSSKPNALKLYAAPVDANYSNRYSYNIKGASKLTFKVVAVPPAPIAEEMKIVPFLIKKTLDDAEQLLKMLNIPYEIISDEDGRISTSNEDAAKTTKLKLASGEEVEAEAVATPARVLSTSPEAGIILKPGQKLILTIKNSTNE